MFRPVLPGILCPTTVATQVQFEYGLRQRRHKKPERRPASFKTAQGKQISVDTAQAVRNNITIERGKV
jgi:exonuclease V